MTTTIYMFHAIGSVESDDWADPHYSYSEEKFIHFLQAVKRVTSIKDRLEGKSNSDMVVTFDDGHISNYKAAKVMSRHNFGTADFFINPDHIGKKYYMSWEQISELHNMGMSIQSHGLDHQYLSDCDDVELHKQLLKSKNIIEEKINSKVTVLAPPGGRFDNRTLKLAKAMGYQCVANSVPGHVHSFENFTQPRVPVLVNHSIEDLINYSSPYSLITLKQKLKYAVLYVAKKILGNGLYEKVRWQIMGGQ